jgi:predicted MPP superfamily phosphohydrolase
MSDSQDLSGDQLSLPFDAEYDAVLAIGTDVTQFPGYRSLARHHQCTEAIRTITVRLVSNLGEGLLRLVLVLLSIAAVVHTFPYQAKVQGVRFSIQASVVTRPGLSADTTLGNWEFPRFTGLPVGIHVSPQDVDLIALADRAGSDTNTFVAKLREDFRHELPGLALWLGLEVLAGVVIGLLMATALTMAWRYVRRRPWRTDEMRHQLRQAYASVAVLGVVVAYGALSYNPRWSTRSELTGTLAAAQLFPSQLAQYYNRGSKAVDALGAVVGIQAALQAELDNRASPTTAFRIMFISDVHLGAVYPLVEQYAKEYDVGLIVNTGDEVEFGQAAELTPSYLASIQAITATVPMLWLAGNHDSPEVEDVMRTIPGVTVLGGKTRTDDGFDVSASSVKAYGLTIAGVPDPRVYGGGGASGSDTKSVTDALERTAVNEAVTGKETTDYDIFATHEPVAAKRLRELLGDRIRQTNSGHVHAQNDSGDIQHGSQLDLVEGSTGAGGLDNLARTTRPPVEFSIESVGDDCQFTRVVRFQIKLEAAAVATEAQAYGDDVSVTTNYFTPQSIKSGRTCSTSQGISSVTPVK